ncbi:helix-turn-helix domain-containing protein [Sphingomonas sp. Leaf17]|uniref:helix-turn-helix domain-containing protein n=1 Tax=Sphingomonas sp. Leaf17 TaxID=1735683 RepID=UPI0009E71855|nr:helix-turn-helix domain-containing protein [Sphingomonas sp. Leaf17]
MTEGDAGTSGAAAGKAGDILRTAREAHGLSLADVAARTRIPLRHLEAIELSQYAGLPSPTYAVGFAKAYARAVGIDEVAAAQAVRTEVDRIGPRTPEFTPYEVADPSRVPSRGVTLTALGIALAVLVLVGLWYATDLLRGGTPGSVPVTETPPATVVAAVPVATPSASGGQVRLAATDEVWMRVYDADGETLYMDTMKPGQAFDVPAGANNPMINVGRPDKLTITLNGSAVPPLGDGSRAIKDVRIGAEALAARLNGTTPAATPSPAAPSRATGSRTERRVTSRRERPASVTTQADETAQANRAVQPAATGNSSAP